MSNPTPKSFKKFSTSEVEKEAVAELEVEGKNYKVDLSEAYEHLMEKYWSQDKFQGLSHEEQGALDDGEHLNETREWLASQTGLPADKFGHAVCRSFYDFVMEWWEEGFKKKLFVQRISERESSIGTAKTQKTLPTGNGSDSSKTSKGSTPSEQSLGALSGI